MSWALTTLTTGLTLRNIEREIVSLADDVSGSGVVLTDGESTTVTMIEADYNAISVGDVITANSLTRYVLSKDDDETFEITVNAAVDWDNEGDGYSFYYQTWSEKSTLAKKIMKRSIENYLSNAGYFVDESSGEVLIDLIANPDIFDLASDYLTLHLIYTDLMLANTNNQVYADKSKYYKTEYENHLDIALKQINIDSDLDGDADTYRNKIIVVGRMTR